MKYLDSSMNKKVYSILAAVLAVVMISSCSKEQTGNPYMLFEVHGKVVDQEGLPISGIQISSGQADERRTNENGSFIFYGKSAPTSYVVLKFEDKDEGNGGEFATQIIEIEVKQKSPGSETGNYKGTYFAGGVEVVMLNKEDGVNPDSGLIPL